MAYDQLIDEAVGQLEGYFNSILTDRQVNKSARVAKCIEDFGEYLKAATAQSMHDRKRRAAARLQAEIAEREKDQLKKVEPMSRAQELLEMHQFIKSTPGAFNSIAKRVISEGGTSLLEHEYVDLWRAEAGSTVAFAKEFEGPRNVRHDGYDIVRNASHVKALGYPNMMSIEPVSTEVGNTRVSDDSKPAIDLLNELTATQRRLSPTLTAQQAFARVYENPDNIELVRRERRENRPDVSSPSYDALEDR